MTGKLACVGWGKGEAIGKRNGPQEDAYVVCSLQGGRFVCHPHKLSHSEGWI